MTNVLDWVDVCLEVPWVLEPCSEETVKRPIVMSGVRTSGRSAHFPGRGV